MTTHKAPSLRPLTELEVQPRGRVRRYFAAHDRVMDAVVVLFVAFGQIGVTAGPTASPASAPVSLALAVIVAAAVWFRRRFPLVVLAVVSAMLVVSLIFTPGSLVGALGFPVAVYAVARYRSPAAAWVGLGTSLVVTCVALVGWIAGESLAAVENRVVASSADEADLSWETAAGSVVLLVMLGLIGLALGVQAYARRQHVAEVVRRTTELVAAGEQNARMASMQERSRIAREMHDIVAHSLSVMIALADGARAVAPKSPQAAAEALDLLAETGRTALTDMRRMLGVLREGETLMAPQPTTDDDVAGLVEVFGQAGLAVRLQADPLPDHPGLRLVVFRVAQEALTNVLRHARDATAADVEVRVADGTVEITVRDDGAVDGHVAPSKGVGKGLVGMRERVAMYSGELEAGPVEGGWQVRATLTVPPPDPSVVAWVLPS